MRNANEFIANTFQNTNTSGNFILFSKLFLKLMKLILENVKSFVKYLIDHVTRLDYDVAPNYSEIQKKINETLKDVGYSNDEDFKIVILIFV
jgi:hypothetical protein